MTLAIKCAVTSFLTHRSSGTAIISRSFKAISGWIMYWRKFWLFVLLQVIEIELKFGPALQKYFLDQRTNIFSIPANKYPPPMLSGRKKEKLSQTYHPTQRAHDVNITSPQRWRWGDVIFTSYACRVSSWSLLKLHTVQIYVHFVEQSYTKKYQKLLNGHEDLKPYYYIKSSAARY